MNYERQGAGYDSGAVGYELQGRDRAPRVKHCKREPREHCDVYVGRPGIWGNPYVVGRDGTRDEVIAKYEEYLDRTPRLLRRLPELRGRNLTCWCAPLSCHADVLLRRANA